MYHQEKELKIYGGDITNVNPCIDPIHEEELALIEMLGLVFSTSVCLLCCQMWKIHSYEDIIP